MPAVLDNIFSQEVSYFLALNVEVLQPTILRHVASQIRHGPNGK
jgi:hypothetical protein